MRTQKIFGYGAALAMLPYLVVKIVWTLAGLRGGGLRDGAWSTLDWTVINGLTVAMAGAAIVLGLALTQRWGLRVPGWLILLPAWIGSGFLVPMVPILPLLLLATGGDGDAGTTPAMPAWEAALPSASFAGFGLGVAVAFPLYVRRRWPHAVTGLAPPGPIPVVARTAAGITAAAGVALGLFAWGTWKATFMYAVTAAYPSPEPAWTLALENHVGALAGAMMLLVVLLVAAERRPVRPGAPGPGWRAAPALG